MSRVTSKLQVTVPKAIALRYGIRPATRSVSRSPGRSFAWCRTMPGRKPKGSTSTRAFVSSTRRPRGSGRANPGGRRAGPAREAGPGSSSTSIAARALIDTNVPVYRYDERFPEKQRTADEILRNGISSGTARIAHQSIMEFVAATTRGAPEDRRLDVAHARREAEELMAQFPILHPDDAVLRMALRGAATYGLSWFDAHLRAHAEVNGIEELLSEDFPHGRMYGTVTVRNPFLPQAARA